MRAKFAVRRNRKVRVFYGDHMADVTVAVFCRGPSYAVTIATDLPETISADFCEVGFCLDLDQRVALLVDAGVCWDARVAAATGRPLGAASRAAGFARLDLLPEEAWLPRLVADARTFEELVEALQRSTSTDGWAGWRIRWGNAADFRAAAAGKLPA